MEPVPLSQPRTIPAPGLADGLFLVDGGFLYQWINDGILNQLEYPHGMISDIASVPRIAWTVSGILPDGRIRAGAIGHDGLYRFAGQVALAKCHTVWIDGEWQAQLKPWTRLECDRLFGRLMREAGVSVYKRRLAFSMVRTFGWHAWSKANYDFFRVSD